MDWELFFSTLAIGLLQVGAVATGILAIQADDPRYFIGYGITAFVVALLVWAAVRAGRRA